MYYIVLAIFLYGLVSICSDTFKLASRSCRKSKAPGKRPGFRPDAPQTPEETK